MARRGGIQIDLVWVHCSLTHPRANDFLTAAQTLVSERLPGVTLSVNRNIALTQALVKITATETLIASRVPGAVRNAIIRIYTEADFDEALAMVTDPAWTGPPPPG